MCQMFSCLALLYCILIMPVINSTLLLVTVVDVIFPGIKGQTRNNHLTKGLKVTMKLCELVAVRVILYEL